MGRQTTHLQVFVASPAELRNERIALESVIQELNQMLSESTGAYLELVKWETHAIPGFGSDPQAVINEQIGEKYDIFIGMLSTKFGSPTPRAASGTEEEFERAYERFIKNPNELRIMFYFKDPEVRASEINLDEYKRVKDFQNKLGQKGLYATFNTTEDFIALVRIHLSGQLQAWAQKKWGQQIAKGAPSSETKLVRADETTLAIGLIDDEELGFLDYVEIGNESLDRGTASVANIEEAITDVGRKAAESTPKLIAAIEHRDVAKQKHIYDTVARALEEFGLRIDTELPIFSDAFSIGIDAISRSVILWESDFNLEDKSPLQALYNDLEALLSGIVTTEASMGEMQQIISGLPRVTVAFNKAKRHAAESLAALNRALSSSLNLTREALREMNRILTADCEPTEEQLIRFMHADTRQAYRMADMPAKQRQEIRDAEVARWKEANC